MGDAGHGIDVHGAVRGAGRERHRGIEGALLVQRELPDEATGLSCLLLVERDAAARPALDTSSQLEVHRHAHCGHGRQLEPLEPLGSPKQQLAAPARRRRVAEDPAVELGLDRAGEEADSGVSRLVRCHLRSPLACRMRPHQRFPSRRQRIAFAPRCEKLSTTRIVPSGQSTGAAAGGTTLVGKPFCVILARVSRPLEARRTRWSDVSWFNSWSAYAAAGRPEASSAKPETPSSVRLGASATTSTRHRLPAERPTGSMPACPRRGRRSPRAR